MEGISSILWRPCSKDLITWKPLLLYMGWGVRCPAPTVITEAGMLSLAVRGAAWWREQNSPYPWEHASAIFLPMLHLCAVLRNWRKRAWGELLGILGNTQPLAYYLCHRLQPSRTPRQRNLFGLTRRGCWLMKTYPWHATRISLCISLSLIKTWRGVAAIQRLSRSSDTLIWNHGTLLTLGSPSSFICFSPPPKDTACTFVFHWVW